MATSADSLIQGLLAGTGFGQTPQQVTAQNLQNQQAQQGLQGGIMQLAALKYAQEQKQKEDGAFDSWWSEFERDPSANRLSMGMQRFPDKYQGLKAGWDIKNEEQRRSDLTYFSQIEAALRNGKADLAAQNIENRISAERKAGLDTTQDEQWLASIKAGDKAAHKTIQAFALANIAAATGTDKFASTYEKVGERGGDFTLGPGSKRYDAAGNLVAEAPFAPRPVTVGEGQTVVEYNPNSGGGDPASGGAATALRSNPGAIKDGPWAKSQPGYSGSSGGFATFETEAQGKAAQMRLLDQNYIRKGYNTPRKIVERYAPRGAENSDASVNNYASYIAGKMGIGVDDSIPPNKVPQLAQAMREFETGNRSGSGGGARVIAQGAPKPTKPGWRVATPQEKAQYGVGTDVAAQVGPDGQFQVLPGQARAQLKPVPTPVVTKVLDNRKAVRNIDGALAELDKYPNGVGFIVGNTPNSISQRTDPKGVNVRSAIANIGSLLIHDRSGAAVTAAETPRLKPFVPLVTDSPATVRKKLQRMRAEIASINEDYETQYSEAQGYRPIAQGGKAPVSVRSIQQAMKLPKGTIYRAPDGKLRRR